MQSKQKVIWGGYNAHPKVHPKVINNERKILTHREINDCISQQIGSVITQV